MKYIDADRLRAEIEQRLDKLNPKIGMFGDRPLRPVNPKTFPRESELEKVLGLIDFLYQEQPSLPSGLDDAAEKYSENILANNEDLQDAIEDAFIAGAKWMNEQMKMPNSSELISEWNNVKTILGEKDFRGDEWRLAYNAFMFGFSKGLNTQKTEK